MYSENLSQCNPCLLEELDSSPILTKNLRTIRAELLSRNDIEDIELRTESRIEIVRCINDDDDHLGRFLERH